MQIIETKTTVTDNYNGWKGEKLVEKLGSRYDSEMDVKDVAKEVRKLIKQAMKEDLLPYLNRKMLASP